MPSFQIGQPDDEEFRGPDARPVTEVLDCVLNGLGRSAPVPAGSVEFHQQMALQAAQQIKAELQPYRERESSPGVPCASPGIVTQAEGGLHG